MAGLEMVREGSGGGETKAEEGAAACESSGIDAEQDEEAYDPDELD